MELKFTSLQERNVYNGSQIRDWCRDGDLVTYVTGEFDIITIMGDKQNNTLCYALLHGYTSFIL